MARKLVSAVIIAASVTIAASRRASGVTVMGDQGGGNDNLFNSTPPFSIGAFNISAYEGDMGGTVATPIAPRYFTTAAHVTSQVIGTTGTFTFNNGTPTTTTTYPVALAAVQNDIAIWKIQDSFTTSFSLYAPLYTAHTELGQPLVVFGHGLARGAPVQGGWAWGGGGADAWGTNNVSFTNITSSSVPGSFLSYSFDRTTDGNGIVTDPDEAILTAGDSGGGVFILDPADGIYKLGGVNYGVDLVQDSAGNTVQYSLYDARTYYYTDSTGLHQITGATAVPLSSYASQLSNQIPFILNATPTTAPWSDATLNHSWNTAGNWSPNGVLSGQRAVAAFTDTGGGGLVTLDGNHTVGVISFSGIIPYTITQGTGGILTIDDSTSTVPNPRIAVINGGSHTISAPINMVNGLKFFFQNSSALTVSNSITGTGTINVKGAGTLTLGVGGTLPAASPLNINTGGKMILANSAGAITQTVASLSIETATASQLDIGKNILNITTTPIATIKGYVVAGGIISSATDTHHGVGYIDNGAGGSKIRYTYFGDTDLNGSVNFTDLVTLSQHYNSTTATWGNGDFNNDSTINFADLVSLAQNYNAPLIPENGLSPSFASDWNLAVSEVTSVPEPTSSVICVPMVLALLAKRRRAR